MAKILSPHEIAAIRSAFSNWADDLPLTEAETAVVVSLSRAWLKGERAKENGGRGPRYVTVAGTVRYLAGDVRAWLSAQVASGERNKRGGPRENKGGRPIAKREGEGARAA